MSCVNKIEVQHQEVFDKLRELVYGHQEDALALYLNLLNKGVDLANHTVTRKDLEYVDGKTFNFQVRYSLESVDNGVSLDSSEEFYRDANNVEYKRTSNVTDEIAGIEIISPEEKAKQDMLEQNQISVLGPDTTYTVTTSGPTFGSKEKKVEELTYDEYVALIKERRDKPRREGKVKHKILEMLLTGSAVAKQELDLMLKLFNVSKNKASKWTKTLKAKVLPYFQDIAKEDIHSEVILSVPEAKIAGTADIVTHHGDGIYSIYDLKTGKLMEGGKLMKFADLDKLPFLSNSKNRNILSIVMYAMMIKYNKPEARFKELVIFNEEGEAIPIYPGMALAVLENYFKKTNIKFYENNKHLFDPANYTAEPEALSELKKNENYKNELATDLYTSMINHREGKTPPKGQRTFYQNLKLKLIDLTGADYLNKGHKIYVDLVGRLFNNVYDVKDPILKSLSKLFLKGDHAQRTELNKINTTYNKLMKPIEKKIAQQRKKRFGQPDYAEEWAFAWDGGKMMTWKAESWNSLSEDEKAFMDFHRWTIRFSLFSTMHPSQGIGFIKEELKQRNDLSEADIKYLEDQIEELSNMKNIDKFKLEKRSIKYFEGWSPRVLKTSEESDQSVSKYTKEWVSSKFELTDYDIAKALENDSVHALPLRNTGGKDSISGQVEGKFTFNAELVFKSFVSSAVRKKHLDEAMVYAEGLRSYLTDVYEYKTDKATYEARKWIESITKAVLLQEVESQGKEQVKIKGKSYSTRKSVMSVRNALSLFSMGINISGMVASSIGITLMNINNAISGSVSKMFGLKNVDMDARSFVEGVMELDTFKSKESREKSKLYQLSKMTGYSVDSYNYDKFNTKVLKTTRGKYLPKWLNYDTLFFGYRMGDRFNYNVNLVAQLKSMKVGDKSMWDCYEMIDGELTYTGPLRGVDKDGNEIRGLTALEIAALKHKSERLFGSYRSEERMVAQNGAITGAFMQFKGYIPSMIKRAWTKSNKSIGLVELMNTGEYMVVDPKSEDYKKRFKKDSEEYKKYEREGVMIAPILSEVEGIEEGYIQSIMAGARYAYYAIFHPNDADREYYNLSDYQKKNIIYSTSMLVDFILVHYLYQFLLGLAGWEDEDEEDTEIVQGILRSKNELLGPFQFIFDRRAADNLTGVPMLSKSTRMLGGIWKMGKDLATNERVESGKYAGEIHGWRDVVATTPLQWFMEVYDITGDVDTFTDTEIQKSVLEVLGLEE